MTNKIAGAALALILGTGSALADMHDAEDMVTVNVEGEMVEVDVETAAEACGMDAEAIQAQAETDAEIAVCEIDQATADEHGIGAEEAN